MDRKDLRTRILATTIILSILGLFFLYGIFLGEFYLQEVFNKKAILLQVVSFVIGFIMLFVGYKIPYLFYKRMYPLIVLGTIFLFIILLFTNLGIELNESKRWIEIFGITFQPSEILKLTTIIFFASILSKYNSQKYTIKKVLFYSSLYFGFLFFISYLQPDTSTLFLILFSIAPLVVYSNFFDFKRFVYVFLILISVILLFVIFFIPDYSRARIVNFFSQEKSELSLSSHFQQERSIKAISEGSFLGKGFGHSDFKRKALPEKTTDTIFAIIAEEVGFVGSSILIFLYIFLFYSIYKVLEFTNKKDKFAQFLLVGISSLFFFQVFINLYVVTGILPVTGFPLLFFSKGGTSIIITLFAIGISLNILKKQ